MKNMNCLKIIIPEELSDLQIKVIRSPGHKNLILGLEAGEEAEYAKTIEQKYAFIWRQNDYLKVPFDEIMWIQADGSYSVLHLTGKRSMVISFHLAVFERQLPAVDFFRIHRSRIVNLRHVVSMAGNSLRIGGELLTIGREYREEFLDRFIFLGVRRAKKKKCYS